MQHRHVVAVCSLVLTLMMSAYFALGPVSRQVRAQTAPASAWTAPRTAGGQPDLQGVWLSNTATPLERPAALAGRARLSDEEVATLQQRADRIFENGRSAFAAGDAPFLAAFENRDIFDAPTSTSSSIGMVTRAFDNRTSMVVDPPDGRIPAETPEARQRQATVADGWRYKTGPEDFSAIHRCITTGVPRLGGNFGAGPYTYYQIVQTPAYVAIVNEAFHDTRLIPLEDRPHLPERVRQWNGDSRGHWEGDSLVVETSNFSSSSYFRGAAEGLHLVERFTRTAPDTLTYNMTFTDPKTWATPWTAEMLLEGMDEAIYEFACHEGNHSMIGMLGTARLGDRAEEATR
jgi:hypothetical protein